MALSMLLSLLGATAVYLAAVVPARSGGRWLQVLHRNRVGVRVAGASLLVAGAVAGGMAEGWGVGLTVVVLVLMLTLSLLALCAPLWPRGTWGAVQLGALALVVAWLGGG
ncbi:hypothetical protein [Hyalangium gracile]|uniref:hypothetical protein n=1 Tax=Hyalangium gracile TaxID=394092 RepID=UPI001CCF7BA7|nr:hypothetical protein [Hyalangium gracile]